MLAIFIHFLLLSAEICGQNKVRFQQKAQFDDVLNVIFEIFFSRFSPFLSSDVQHIHGVRRGREGVGRGRRHDCVFVA